MREHATQTMKNATDKTMQTHSAHWGVFQVGTDPSGALHVQPHPADPDPNPLIDNFRNALSHRARIATPMVRKGWLENGPGADDRRGRDEFVALSWEKVLDLLAGELRRVKEAFGPGAVFGGSYGWSSAGRFHHAQSQVHRFLNIALGGYVRSVNNYSAGASMVILPHVVGQMEQIARRSVSWDQIAEHTEVVLAFGGLALKNSRVASGGVSQHVERGCIAIAATRGCRFVGITPQRSDMPEESRSEWLCVTPGTDTALMLALAHTLVSTGRHDRAFVERYCDGWERFSDYLLGRTDGIPKSAAWAAPICGISENALLELARSLPGKRVLVTVSHSLQRAEHGEQPVWMGLVLAALLGQIGLPGGGYGYALGTLAHYGRRNNAVPVGSLPQGRNGVSEFIPVARVSDMLLHPGEPFDYNGRRLTYPNIRLAYWAGGNPFHHHQDLERLTQALRRLETFVVHEVVWTATARHADMVLPCTMTLERDDIGAGQTDPLMVAMRRVCPPHGMARDDYDIFCDLSRRLGALDLFSEGRDTIGWLRYLYEPTRAALLEHGLHAPSFEEFWAAGELKLPQLPDDGGMLRAFREDPDASALPTPSGRIQLSSTVIGAFGYEDCPAHPAWIPPKHGPAAQHPLWLISNQPAARLHSQLDFGMHSQSTKRQGREVCTMHPAAAASRGIGEGSFVRVFNGRGSFLAVARLCAEMHEAVVQVATGAWLDLHTGPDGHPMCAHGNPNILTFDEGTSRLAQGCSGQLCAVNVERFVGQLPPIRAYDPPVED
ncbi:biotin/methionine sulfoxide reductase [Variovorax sp. HW608]|uniref:molybdopterin-dependent oxidoreductase n=1 Tax=Variovorax sp. HW608 TaxID=1034889 RepID=UPI00081F853E|nr:biotin/methionine sulfoxide reductase [Variovorax sp. HW608]